MTQRLMVDQCLKLDIHRLYREGYLVPNSQFEWIWPGKDNQTQVIQEWLPFQWTPCNGGRRHWIECPGCSRRIVILYLREERFWCRTCHGLLYSSQYPQ